MSKNVAGMDLEFVLFGFHFNLEFLKNCCNRGLKKKGPEKWTSLPNPPFLQFIFSVNSYKIVFSCCLFLCNGLEKGWLRYVWVVWEWEWINGKGEDKTNCIKNWNGFESSFFLFLIWWVIWWGGWGRFGIKK
jgi:hypothetical protein